MGTCPPSPRCASERCIKKRPLQYIRRWDNPYIHVQSIGSFTVQGMGDEGMNPIFRFLLTRIALLAMVNYAANAQADAPQAGVVLEASEIYSSTVEVGDFVVVVYGREKRQPISGTRARLDTARGYIKAVNQRRLIVGLEPDGWSKWIALNRIQALVLVGSPSPDAIARASALATAAVEAATVAATFLTSADQEQYADQRGRRFSNRCSAFLRDRRIGTVRVRPDGLSAS